MCCGVPVNVISITNINQAKSDNHTFIAATAATQEQALIAFQAAYPWFDVSGGWGYWLETKEGGTLWIPANRERKMP